MPRTYSEIAFTPDVRAEQRRLGSAEACDRLLAPERPDGAELTSREADFLASMDGVFQATVSETGWPYVQFRGGARGFLRTIDARTIGYADYRGNRQYISAGNLRGDDRVSIIAVDYARRRRLKLLGRARITEDPEIVDLLNVENGPTAERAILIRVVGYDWNCPQHIPIRLTDAERGDEIAALTARIRTLEQALASARGRGRRRPGTRPILRATDIEEPERRAEAKIPGAMRARRRLRGTSASDEPLHGPAAPDPRLPARLSRPASASGRRTRPAGGPAILRGQDRGGGPANGRRSCSDAAPRPPRKPRPAPRRADSGAGSAFRTIGLARLRLSG